MLEAALRSRLGACLRPDPVVELAARRWSEAPASLAVGVLAQEAGLAERQLHRRFLHAAGYGPERLQRVLRFQAFLRRSGAAPAGPAELAAARAGVSDPFKTGGSPRRRPGP